MLSFHDFKECRYVNGEDWLPFSDLTFMLLPQTRREDGVAFRCTSESVQYSVHHQHVLSVTWS